MTDDEYISAAEAGEILSVSERQALRYAAGPDAVVRSRRVGRRVLLHVGDVRALADQRAIPQGEQDAGGRLVQSTALSVRVEEQQRELVQAAHTIGVLEERVRQLEAQLAQRPQLEDHGAVKAERDTLRRELDEWRRVARPWWRRLLG